MKTKLWMITHDDLKDTQLLDEAATLLKRGQTVAFPTETVYGLGASALDEKAIKQIFVAKGRPSDNPLIVHIARKEQLEELVTTIPTYVRKLIDTFSPGPITYVLNHSGICAKNVTAGLETIAVRIPDHPTALTLLEKSNIPIAAPSANLSGKPSPTSAQHVIEDLSGKISGIVDGGITGVGVESTVLDCTGDTPIILRYGGVTREQLSEVVGPVLVDQALDHKESRPKSPGMKYKHYAPEIPLILVYGNTHHIQKIIYEKQLQSNRVGLLATEACANAIKADKIVSLGNDETEIAQNLYRGLRAFTKKDVDLIVCESYPKKGVGRAIMDRLERAATQSLKFV